jgi:hypothetical protein
MTVLPTGDTLYGVLRPNWVSNTGVESVTSNMEFITISTCVDIRTFAQNITAGNSVAVATQSQANLNKLLEIVALRGQPVIMGPVTTADTNTYFTIFFANEHAGAWFNASTVAVQSGITMPDVRTGEDLSARIIADGVNFGFGVNTTADTPAGVNDIPGSGTNGGLAVVFSSVL